MLAFLAVGTLWWLLLTVGFVVWMFYSVAAYRPIMAAICLVLFLALLQWASGVHMLEWLGGHPLHVALAVLAYFAAGVVWSFPRWWLHIRKWARVPNSFPPLGSNYYENVTLEEYRKKWVEHELCKLDAEDRAEHNKAVRSVQCSSVVSGPMAPGMTATPVAAIWATELESIRPKAVKNVSKITTWIIYWPWSVLVSLFEDLLREVARWVVERLRHVYDAIGKSALRNA